MRYMIFFTVVIFTTELLYARKYYTIQLATGHNDRKGFEFIRRESQKLTEDLKKEARIVLDGNYYILYATLSDTRERTAGILPEYKKLFKDAYIRTHDPSKVELIADFSGSPEHKSEYTDPMFSNDMLIDRTIYALYTNEKDRDNIALISLELHNDFTMHFRVLIGEKYRGRGKYFVDFQGRFYVYYEEENRYNDFYILKRKEKDYMIVEAWENGKKTDNGIVFFYSLAKAQEYLATMR